MIRTMMVAAALTAALPAAAQERQVSGTRLDVVATGEVNRVPDTMRINAGVMTQAPTATEAIGQNARQMESMRAALRRAGVADRDIQTTAINLQPEWRYAENSAPVFLGYRAHNSVGVRFRDIANAGRILDALVAAGANQIDGPTLYIERPEPALDEARMQAVANARARADLYARTLGMRVTRILSVSEAGMVHMPRPEQMMARDVAAVSGTQIVPGEQTLTVSLTVSFELQ
ncbi:MAG TPA: SIMPL domain-containing protein [Allosphingosinicella sp.]|nr:SIMPL domain-containing protein [Allosphingosinicella sp.]